MSREKYKSPRQYVKEAVIQTLTDEIEKNGEKAPKDLIEEKADIILSRYETLVVSGRHSYKQVIAEGFLINFLWWLFVLVLSVCAYLSRQESIKAAVRAFLMGQ